MQVGYVLGSMATLQEIIKIGSIVPTAKQCNIVLCDECQDIKQSDDGLLKQIIPLPSLNHVL
jgi:hypothetical protein